MPLSKDYERQLHECAPDTLRGFALADQGADTRLIQDYLGHRNMQHTVMYTVTNPARL
jgi:site-specific recombinase XerD